ncbi:uncharacterized protein N7529_010253 [Penicillium soppii]|uniref:uncharacterized protein n=1 Tax=Penicillium soppii TaxID=69789 RepID=UPI002547E63D|nr:uncharacterized protein N7529_010253 [Penicillium soppii]KAJ5856309.1 hypothetical protein N7529_010253 [Penicillium soppii]
MQHPQPPIPQILRLPIAKFSHTTTLIDHVGPLTWNHVTGNGDMYCIFERFFNSGPMPSRLIQKVFRGDAVLEQLDLVYFIQMVAMQSQLSPPPKSHFAVVVKSPCIAVKYPYRGTQIRRFQIKLTTEPDYFLALTVLGEVNCPLTEADILNITAPVRASSPASTVSYSMSRFGPPLPAFTRPSLNIEPTAANERLYGSTSFPNMSRNDLEVPNSQSSAVSAPATKKRQSSTVTQATPEHQEVQPSKSSKDQEVVPLNLATDPEPGPGFVESQSQILSQPPLFSQPSQPFLIYEEPPASAQIPANGLLVAHTPQAPSVPNSILAHHNPRDSNLISKPDDKPGQEPMSRTASAMTEDQLAEYLAFPTSERVVILQNWMCELMEDDKFMALCQDVEGTWRRFAFGQKQ